MTKPMGGVKIPQASNGYFLRDDGTWAAAPAGPQGPAQHTPLATFVANVGVPGFNTEQSL